MKRNFREPKNRYKNGAKIARRKIASLKTAQSLENKGIRQRRKPKKSCKLTQDGTKIRLHGAAKNESDP